MNKSNLEGKSLAVILWGEDEKGKDEVFVYNTKFQTQNETLIFKIPSNIYENNSSEITLDLTDEYLSRLKVVSDDLKQTLNDADYSLSLTVGSLPEENYS